MIQVLVAGLIALHATGVLAQTSDRDDALRVAARNGQAVEFVAFGGLARAVPVPGARPCAAVGVIYEGSGSARRGGPRIDNFLVCGGESPRQLAEVSPALPDDARFRQAVLASIRNSLRSGAGGGQWGSGAFYSSFAGYEITSRRLSELDRQGCAITETIVSNGHLLVSYNSGRACL